MENKSKLLDFTKIKEKFSGSNGVRLLLLLGFVGIALIFLSEFWASGSKTSSISSTSSSVTTEVYISQTEKNLKNIIGKINGVGRVEVMVTVDNGVQYVYEQNQKASTDKTLDSGSDGSTQTQENNNSEQSPVIIDNGNGGQQPIVTTEIQPTIKGVVIICDGGDNPVVVESVTSTVMTALNLQPNHISVSKYVSAK